MLFSCSHRAALSLACLLVLSIATPSSTNAAGYHLSAAPLGRMFEGIGGLSGGGATSRLLPDYGEPQRSDILDYLFTPGVGASLHILKVEIGGDTESTEGTEASHMHTADDENFHRGYEWWLMREAKRRNPDIKLYGLSWGFPGWVAEGGGDPFTNSTARYITNWIRGAREVHGLHIDYVGLWNEQRTNRDYTITLRRHLDAANFTNTHVITADGGWGICDELVNDPEYAAAVYALGAHYPNSATSANCAKLSDQGKRLWASEDFSTRYTAGGCWTRLLSHNYVLANLTSTISWNLGSFYYDELPWGKTGLMTGPEPWSGWWDVSSVFWVTAHHTQFTRYGWHYLAHGSGVGRLEQGGTYVSLTDGEGNLTIIMEAVTANVSRCQYSNAPTDPISQQTVAFTLGAGFESVSALNVFYSSMDPAMPVWFEYRGQIKVVGGTVTLTVSPNDLWTLSTLNGTKTAPGHPIPPHSPFPLPYSDNFDDVRVSGFPKYFDDQSGSFEIVAANDTAHGHVVRQAVPMRPVAWCGDAPLTFSVMGSHDWRALSAEIEVLIESTGTVFLATSVRQGGCVGGGGSDGIVLALTVGQGWLVSNSTTLAPIVAQGKLAVNAGEWVKLKLEVGEGGTSVSVGGKEVAMLTELTSAQHQGWLAIGSSYDYVQYDNLVISHNTTRTAKRETVVKEKVAVSVATE